MKFFAHDRESKAHGWPAEKYPFVDIYWMGPFGIEVGPGRFRFCWQWGYWR